MGAFHVAKFDHLVTNKSRVALSDDLLSLSFTYGKVSTQARRIRTARIHDVPRMQFHAVLQNYPARASAHHRSRSVEGHASPDGFVHQISSRAWRIKNRVGGYEQGTG